MIGHILQQTVTVYATSLDEYGDDVPTGSEDYPCRFREITEQERVTNIEYATSDALLWLQPGAAVAEGTVVLIGGQTYRVRRITKARKFGAQVEFLKCLLEVNEPIEAGS